MDRADHLKVVDFSKLGRLQNVNSRVQDAKFSSKAYGTRESKETPMAGRYSFFFSFALYNAFFNFNFSLKCCFRFIASNAARVQIALLFAECGVRRVPWRAEGGRASLDHY